MGISISAAMKPDKASQGEKTAGGTKHPRPSNLEGAPKQKKFSNKQNLYRKTTFYRFSVNELFCLTRNDT